MKTQKPILILSVIFIIATFIHIGVVNRKIKRLNEINQLQAVELSTLNDSVLVYQNKAGELTYKLSVVEVSHSNLKESLEQAGFEIKKLKEKDINWRKVNNALKLQLYASGQGETALTDSFYIMKTDTIRYNAFAWSNEFLNLQGSVQNERRVATLSCGLYAQRQGRKALKIRRHKLQVRTLHQIQKTGARIHALRPGQCMSDRHTHVRAA
jgi:hypothetical protein